MSKTLKDSKIEKGKKTPKHPLREGKGNGGHRNDVRDALEELEES